MKSKTTWLVLSIILNVFLILFYFINRSKLYNTNNANYAAEIKATEDIEKEDIFSFAPIPKKGSGRITKAAFKTLDSTYAKDGKRLKTIDSTTDIHKPVTLEGFVFDAKQIREILDTNKSGKTPDQLAIYFGLIRDKGILETGIHRRRNWHLITLGRYQGTLLDYNQNDPKGGAVSAVPALALKEASIFDKAIPCPPCTQ
jgi:hypothetical protein